MPAIETERLLLRGWNDSDVEPYRRMLADREVMGGMGSGPRHRARRLVAALIAAVSDRESRAAIARHRRHWRRHGHGLWAIEERESGELAGYVGLLHHDDWHAEPTRLEVGWMLRRPSWGLGYASEGGAASLDFAFTRLGAERVISITGPTNERSQRVMGRLGMRRAGAARWRHQAMVWYGIDRDEWTAGRGFAAPTPG